jgi:hypothetical protein
MLTNKDLDECHGMTSKVWWDGHYVRMYHYVLTAQFPYSIGCFRGAPVKLLGVVGAEGRPQGDQDAAGGVAQDDRDHPVTQRRPLRARADDDPLLPARNTRSLGSVIRSDLILWAPAASTNLSSRRWCGSGASPNFDIAGVCGCFGPTALLNLALTSTLPFNGRVQSLVPEQAPPHPANVEPGSGEAVSV